MGLGPEAQGVGEGLGPWCQLFRVGIGPGAQGVGADLGPSPTGLRVQRRVFSTAGVKAHYLGDIVITRAKKDASARDGKRKELPLPRAISRDKGTKWRAFAQATSCIN